MVSRRNFAAITIMLIILLFMFQFTGVMKDKLSKYGINEYKESATTELTKQDMYLASGQNIQKTAGVLYIGNSEAVKNTVNGGVHIANVNFRQRTLLMVSCRKTAGCWIFWF